MAYLKSRPVWIQLALFGGLSAIGVMIISFIGVLILSKITGIPLSTIGDTGKWNVTDERYITVIRGMQLAQFIGLFLVPVFLFAALSDPKPSRYLRLNQPWKPAYYLMGILIMLAAIPLSGLLGEINKSIPFPNSTLQWMKEAEAEAEKAQQILLSKHTLNDLFLNFFFVAALAGVGEELFFRGVLQRLFIRWTKSPWAGILIAAAIFSAIHMQFMGFLPRFMLGILLGALYWYSGSLWASILAHFFYDAFILLMIYLNPQMASQDTLSNEKTMLWVWGLISLAAVVAVLWWMKKSSQTQYADIYKDDAKDYTNPFLN